MVPNMKRLASLFVIAMSTKTTYAAGVVLKCDLELASGKQISGYTEAYIDSRDPCGQSKQVFADALVQQINQRRAWGFRSDTLHKNFYPLQESFGKESSDFFADPRHTDGAYLDSEAVKVDENVIKARVYTCVDSNSVAPIVVLTKNELAMLQKPPKAIFSVEAYDDGAGVVNLISYNLQWNTPRKLESLLKEFVIFENRGKPWRGEDAEGGLYWWGPIYKNADKFKQQYLPQGIVLLIYHVPD